MPQAAEQNPSADVPAPEGRSGLHGDTRTGASDGAPSGEDPW